MPDSVGNFGVRDRSVYAADLNLQRIGAVELRHGIEKKLIQCSRSGPRSASGFHQRHSLPPIGSDLTRRLQQQNEPHRTTTNLRSFVLRRRIDHDRIDGRAEEERMETNRSSGYTARVGGIDDGRLPTIVHQLTQLRVALRDDGKAHDVRFYRAVARVDAVPQLDSELVLHVESSVG